MSHQRSMCPGRSMSRRRFLRRMNAAAAGLAISAPWIPSAIASSPTGAGSKVALARLNTYDRGAIRGAMEAMFNAIGGLADIVRPGDHVGIKINLTGGHDAAVSYSNATGGMHPGETYWTHPEVLRAVGELFKDAGAGRLTFTEAIYDQESYSAWGYSGVANELGADFVDLNGKAPYSGYAVRSVGTRGYIYNDLTQNGILNDFDCVVSLAKSKRHNGAGVTHGMKNLVGTLPLPSGLYNNGQGYRAGIHALTNYEGNTFNNLRRVILDLNHATPIHLVVNDAIKTVLGGEGPWGPSLTPIDFNTLIASKDPVAADAIATQQMGFNPMAADFDDPYPDGLNYLRLAQNNGMGTADPTQMDIIRAYGTGSEHPTPLDGFELSAFPNPFSHEMAFEVTLQEVRHLTLEIFDMTGRRVFRVLNRSLSAGRNLVEWRGQGWHGPLPAGVYMARLASGPSHVDRMIVKSQ